MALAQQYQPVEKDFYTEEEYFEIERTSLGRCEYVNGKIRMMAGGTDDHNAISGNLVRALGTALVPRGCRVYGLDMKVHTPDNLDTFPDVSVVCGPRIYHRGRKDIITNPLLIAEVLSDSTAGYDLGDKFRHYQTIPSLTDYLLVAQDEVRVLLYTRRDDYWEFRVITGLGGTVSLPSVEVTLALSDIYALIELTDGEISEYRSES
jgi:Uma2 family endonuclease